jgi:hypothetical protein
MERNLYAPPAAPVADPVETRSERPRQVGWAVWLLWISLAGALISSTLDSISLFTFGGVLMPLISRAIRYLVTAWINIKVAEGRNWARILVLLWTLAAVVMVAYEWRSTLEILARHSLTEVLDAVKLLLDCTTVVLLFTPAANRWFKQ